MAALASQRYDVSGGFMRCEIEGTVMTAEVWHKSRRADGGLMEPLSGVMPFSMATQGRTEGE
jgi:hypothetical protein